MPTIPISQDYVQGNKQEDADSPREAVKIMSGFSEEVAIAVIHPEWPAKEPLKVS